MSKDKNTLTKAPECVAFLLDENSQEVFKKLPADELNLKITVISGDVHTAYEYFKSNRTPSLLVVDVSKSAMAISDVGKLAEVCEPGVEVIVVGENNDIGVYRGLLKLGVKDYIAKPLSDVLLVKTIKNLHSDSSSGELGAGFSRYGKLVTFLGAHGGVGTTSLASNAAFLMAQEYHRRVALLDLDLQRGMISHLFNQNPSPGIADMLSSPERVDNTFMDRLLVHVNEHLSIACGQETVIDHDRFSIEAFQKMLELVCENYHYAFVDCPSHARPDTVSFLLNSSQIVVLVIDFTIFSIRNASLILQQLSQSLGKGQRIHVVANRLGEYRKGELTQEVVEKTINHPIDLTLRFDGNTPLEFANIGSPFATQKSDLTNDVRELCKLLSGSVKINSPVKGFLKSLGLK